jgi:large subunit ribosomal protein L22
MRKKELTARGHAVVAQAFHHHAGISARKARLVIDLIRDKSVGEAERILKFTLKPSAVPHVERVLKSALSNVPSDFQGDPRKDLRVGEAFADAAFMLKRFRPRAMGRACKIRKRSSHISIRLTAL